MVLARAAIEAYDWIAARNALAPFVSARLQPSTSACLMAEIEEGQSGDQGKAREWLARAVRAPADPAWTADGITSEEWAPVSPVTGKLDAFEWKVPVERQPATRGPWQSEPGARSATTAAGRPSACQNAIPANAVS